MDLLNKAIFLDRDGVINRERGDYTFRIEDFQINEGVFECLAAFQKKGYLLILITNQGGISRGIYTTNEFESLSKFMLEQFENEGIRFTEIYYCPHYSGIGKCLCRKPGSLLLEKALARFQIDPQNSFMIGDSERDMDAARAAGVKGLKVKPNENIFQNDQIRKIFL
jgi:D-glycero-D-manno-heptose 1,7-bisphosphate phosphatase